MLGTVSYHMEKTTIEENYRQSYETMLKNSSKILDLKLKPIIDKGRSILTNSQLCEVLENGSKDGEHEFSLEDQKVSSGKNCDKYYITGRSSQQCCSDGFLRTPFFLE
ncbi:MAG: hypothetical protein ACLVC1_12465 [Mediterraneibacter gnavus]